MRRKKREGRLFPPVLQLERAVWQTKHRIEWLSWPTALRQWPLKNVDSQCITTWIRQNLIIFLLEMKSLSIRESSEN